MVRFGGLRIGGLSGIFKARDYARGHFEHPPYNEDTKRSCYHIRNVDVFRLKQVTCLDVFLFQLTVKPFYLVALKVGNFTCKFILAPFILANSYYTMFRQHTMPIKVGILWIFVPFNFTVLFSSRNKGHVNIKGFTVIGLSGGMADEGYSVEAVLLTASHLWQAARL